MDRTNQNTHPAALDPAALAEVATAVWRLAARVEAHADATPAAVRRHAQGVADALAEAGFTMRGFEGTAFDPGMRLRVLAYQPTPGLAREEVIETVRPAVYLHGEALARGEVIVGIPLDEEKDKDSEKQDDD
ncbi:hypothetical protein [Streptomyces sp. 6N223]|uniref:hypothetical protein n=1 Tax=Streptomyces sp. 6N223 TaxID=3457412 RepID=UPI003FD5D53F